MELVFGALCQCERGEGLGGVGALGAVVFWTIWVRSRPADKASYILMNLVRKGLRERVEDWRWVFRERRLGKELVNFRGAHGALDTRSYLDARFTFAAR